MHTEARATIPGWFALLIIGDVDGSGSVSIFVTLQTKRALPRVGDHRAVRHRDVVQLAKLVRIVRGGSLAMGFMAGLTANRGVGRVGARCRGIKPSQESVGGVT